MIKKQTPALNWQDNLPLANNIDCKNWIVVLPLGAFEQHGPHLPFDTDTLIATAVVEKTAHQITDKLPVSFMPCEPIGYSPEHTHVEGTKTLSFDGAINKWLKIAEDLHSHGIRKLVLFNAHGGNSPLMTIIAHEARNRFQMLVATTSWNRFGYPNGMFKEENRAIDIHAGDIETSIMLAIAPEKVSMKKAQNFPSNQTKFANKFKHLRAHGPHSFGWMMSDLNINGAVGNAANASIDKGERMLDHAAKGFAEFLNDVHLFDCNQLR